MADLQLTATVSSFPSGATYNTQQFANAFAARLAITLPGTNVFFGQLGGTEPVGALPGNGATPGLWFDGFAIRSWNTDSNKYLPIAPIAGNYTGSVLYEATLKCGNLTSNTTLNLPVDKSGILALTSDFVNVIGTQTLSGTTVTLDWTKKQAAYLVLTGNTIINHSGQQDGQIQDLFLENNATSYTVTINGTTWPGNTSPTMTTATATHRKIDRWRFFNQGGSIGVTFGQVLNNKTGNADYVGAAAAYDISTTTDTTQPSVSSITGVNQTAFITIAFTKLLQGATLSVSDFIVKKGGATQTILVATANGTNVSLQLNSNLSSASSYTVQYTGTSVKDLAGNTAAVFGPSAVTITNSSDSSGGGTGQ
jgi:Big-like domain-containing protein